MSNHAINQSGVPASTLAMRAEAPGFGTEGRLHENRVGGKGSAYPSAGSATTLRADRPESAG